MGKRIGLFGGSFDPIHLGHLNLANEMRIKKNLDEVWFCPTSKNPLKPSITDASPEQRVEMVRLAIEGSPHFKVIEIEAFKEGPSYTIDTVNVILAQHPEIELFLLLGLDSALSFHSWKNAEEIIEKVTPIIGFRANGSLKIKFEGSAVIQQALQEGIQITDIFEISSTEIRDRLKKGLDCSPFLPPKVLDYIRAHHLYCSQ